MLKKTKVKDLMTPHPQLISPDTTLQEAARKMKRLNCGVLPVGTKDKLEGIITDRDIVIRAVAKGGDISDEKVRVHMSKNIYACSEDDTLREAADQMHQHKISRLVVKNQQGKTTGILTFGCILRKDTNVAEVSDVVEHAVGRAA